MIFGKKKQKTTTPYMPGVRAAIDKKEFVKAIQILQNATVDYYGRISEVEGTIPADDVAIVIKLHRHIANELERADPIAAKYVKAMEKIELPPIEYRRTK